MVRLINKQLRYSRAQRGLMIVAIVAAASIVTTIVFARSARKAAPVTNSAAAAAVKSSLQSGHAEVEIVTLRPWGFEPQEINRPPGPFFLAVENHSGFKEIDVSLDANTGTRLRAIGVSKNKKKWRQKMVLAPGTYLLREANHPEWACRITVQP